MKFLERLFRRKPRTLKVGLALSGGGVRGLAHIGVLKVLEREGVPIHFLAGTSAGGLVAAAYAAGRSAQELEQEALQMTTPRRMITLVERIRPWRGLLSGDKVRDYLAQWLGELTFDQLQVPLALLAVDLNKGRKVVLREGSVPDAVRATIALPGLLRPLEMGDQTLVDGGLLDNLPADVVRQMGADVVIAVDVSTDMQAVAFFAEEMQRRPLVPDALMDTVTILWRSVGLVMEEINRRILEETPPDLLIRPSLPSGVTVFTGLTRVGEAIAAGERAAEETLPRVRELLER